MKEDQIKYLIIGLAIVVSVYIASSTLFNIANKEVVVVTGLGEQTFSSDKIVWKGRFEVEALDKIAGYKEVARYQKIVADYLAAKGVDEKEVTYSFVSVDKKYESIYNNLGNYVGSRSVGYIINQSFTVVSNDVDKIELISREISSLISQGVNIWSFSPEYYYTKLDDLKLSVIELASKDAHARAQKIVENAGGRLGKASNASLGVFQITSATGDDEYSYGGVFNTTSREKKARITVKVSYKLK